MTPKALASFLDQLVRNRNQLSTMIWGPPGIGKSSIVAQTARAHGMGCIDLRLSQLAPTDLRGLPVAVHAAEGAAGGGVSRWYPPEFLPREGAGILFLDEVNLAPPAMQGMAQQLILDRKVGSYCYDDRTRVMTRRGLKLFRDLDDGDEVMTLNPATGMVEFHVPTHRIELAYKGDMLHFTGKCLSLCVSPDHNMYVRPEWASSHHFMTARELAERRSLGNYRIKRTGDWPDQGPCTITIPASSREQERVEVYARIAAMREEKTPVAEIAQTLGLTKPAVESRLYYGKDPARGYNQARTFDTGDWAEFMGWYVTEGSTARYHNYRVHIAQSRIANPDSHQRIRHLLDRMGLSATVDEHGFTVHSAALYEYLAPLGTSAERYVPDEVKALPKAALRRFFEAALAGDGSEERKLFTASAALRDDYCEIAIKLGYGVTFSYWEGSGYARAENGTWVIGLSQTQNLESGIRSVASVPYEGTIYCVTVPDHIILVERDGKLAWCGNCVPSGWFIWAAGNRKEDRAAVYDMPAPLANRFVHLMVEPDFESFKAYALEAGAHEQIMAFLSFRPGLLHQIDPHQPAWPSPRSWMMASALHAAALDVATVVGAAAAAEFAAFVTLYAQLPNVERILEGAGEAIPFPKEPSVRYATTVGLTMRATSAQESYHAFRWLADRAGPEWAQLFAADLFRLARARNEVGKLALLAQRDPRLKRYLQDYMEMLGE